MLARKYSNYALEEAQRQEWLEQQKQEQRDLERRQSLSEKLKIRNQKNSLTVYVAQGVVLFMLVSCFAMFGIHQEEIYFTTTNQVSSVHKNLTNLVNTNKELEIQVENLKRAERISEIARKELSMVVARSNVYVDSKKE
jgi:cell division protein FtsL